MSYNPAIKDGILYLDGGREDLDGSKRIAIESDADMHTVEERVNGLWQTDSLHIAANTLWVGHNVGVGGIGHYLATESLDRNPYVYPHSAWDGQLTTQDTRIFCAYNYTTRVIFQPDNTGLFT